MAEQAAREGTTMAEKAAIYNRLIKTGLEIEMEQMREQLPDAFRRVVGTHGSAFEAAFFGMDHGRPIVAIVVYQIANLPDQRVALQCQVLGCVIVYDSNTWSNAFMGMNDEIMQYGGDVNFWNSNGSDEAIRKLIQIEMAAHPDFVGGDIDMLSISTGGARWIEHGRECPEVKPITSSK
jgi:hypothetical protein